MRRFFIIACVLFMQASTVAQAAPLQQDCSGVAITSPRASGDPVRGRVTVSGSASIPNFQFYKVEFAPSANPSESSFANMGPDVRRTEVKGGLLDTWDTTGIADGPYTIRLTVVDIRGNFPCPPIVVRPVVVSNRAPLVTNTPTIIPTEIITPTVGPSSAATRPPAPTIAVPTSAARGTLTTTAALTDTTPSRPLFSFDFLPNVTQALLWGVLGMAIVLVVAGVYIIARYILDQL